MSEKNSVSVDCLVLLVLDGWVDGVAVVDVVLGCSHSSSEEACSRRGQRPGPVRALRMCIASGVSLPLVSVGDVSEGWSLRSLVSASGCWFRVAGALRVAVIGWSVRWRIIWDLHALKACWPCTVWPVSGSMTTSFVELRVRGNGNGSLAIRCCLAFVGKITARRRLARRMVLL